MCDSGPQCNLLGTGSVERVKIYTGEDSSVFAAYSSADRMAVVVLIKICITFLACSINSKSFFVNSYISFSPNVFRLMVSIIVLELQRHKEKQKFLVKEPREISELFERYGIVLMYCIVYQMLKAN